MSQPLWTPSPDRVARAKMTAFMRDVEARAGVSIPDYARLYQFSIDRPADFWRLIWDFAGVRGTMGERVIEYPDRMPGARYFPDARINFAENMLRRRDDAPAIIFNGEGRRRRTLTYAELFTEVAAFAAALRRAGIRPGDRVAAYVPNMPETIVAALGTAALGAVWSSCSPDFGVQGVLDRFGQIEPRILIAADGYFYGGRTHDLTGRLADVVRALPTVERTVVIPYVSETPRVDDVRGAVLWPDFVEDARLRPAATEDEALRPSRTDNAAPEPLAPNSETRIPRPASRIPDPDIQFEQLPFNHPLYILYSSGTTGVPKCIVHGAGGTLVQHLKEHQLHCDIQAGDRVFYFTTAGWMMWNWLVSVLASEATLLLYDGSPFHPDGNVLFDFAQETGMTLFGTSSKFIDAVNKAGLEPIRTYRLETVRTLTATGSPLAPESFDFVYEKIKRDVHLASISGGTDIVSLFVGGNPIGPVWRGEIQVRGLGMRVEVFDDDGRPVPRAVKGELVCTMPFPSMPVGFWNDPDGRKYHAAYFDKYPGVWRHGDYVELTGHDGMIIYGRSDAVLNPGGVRIGTAEIYRQVEQLDEIVESLVIGQHWDNDERVVLFVKLREGQALTPGLVDNIRGRIRENTSPRHVPARIVQVTAIPRTKSGKIVELAVRDVVHGREVKNREALANPEALDEFRNRAELQT